MTASEPQANGRCWCGCGGEVRPGRFFVQNHDRWAEAYVLRSRYGTIAAFLEHHGYGPGGKSARQEADHVADGLPGLDQAAETEADTADPAEAERRLSDPGEIPIPYEEARRSLRLI